jgi:hypothetical protein
MNNSQSLSQDIIYNVNFSNDFSSNLNGDFSINDSNSITEMLINEKFISEKNSNESNSNEPNNIRITLSEWYEDQWYVRITGIFATVIILISIYIFIQYF